jgi:hypothetical protein
MSKFASCERRGPRRALRCRKGVTALEFAMIAPVFFLLLFFTMDLARYWYTAEAVRSYTGEVLRAAIIAVGADNPPQNDLCSGGAIAIGTPPTPGLDPAKLQTTVTCRRTVSQGSITAHTVQVTVNYTFQFLVGLDLFWDAQQVISDRQTTTF